MRGRRLLPLGAWLVLAGALSGAPPRSGHAGDPSDDGAPRLRRAKPAWTVTLTLDDSVAAVLTGRGADFCVVLRAGALVRLGEDGGVLGSAVDLGIGAVVEALPGGAEDAWSLRGTAGTAFVCSEPAGGWSVRATRKGPPPDGAYLGIDATRSVHVGSDGRLRYAWDRDGERAEAVLGRPRDLGAPVAAAYDPWRDAILSREGNGIVATRLADGERLAPWDTGAAVVRLAVEPFSGAWLAGREDGVLLVHRDETEVSLLPPVRDAIDPADWDGGPVVAFALESHTNLVAVARGARSPPAVLVHDGRTGRALFRCVPPAEATGPDVALGWCLETLVVGWGRRVEAFRFDPRAGGDVARGRPAPRAEMLSAGIEPLLRPVGVEGMPVQVAAGGGAWATVWADGSVTVRAGGRSARRVPPPGDGETFRRAAVTEAGTVVALTSRGRLFELVEGGPRPIPVTGVQSSARMAPDARSADHLWLGGESGTLFRLGVRDATLEAVSGDGQAPITALASEPRGALVGRADGTVVRHRPGKGDTPPLWTARGSIALLAAGRSWDGAVASDGLVHAFWVPAVTVGVEGRIVAIAARGEDLVVFHEPCCVTQFSMRDHAPIAVAARFLDGRVRAACAIDGGFLVATDAGERIVRFDARVQAVRSNRR